MSGVWDDVVGQERALDVLRAAVLRAPVFFAPVFFAAVFLAPPLFFAGTLPPSRRASDRPIAIACFLLLTVLPDPPLFSVPRLRSCIAFWTFSLAFLP